MGRLTGVKSGLASAPTAATFAVDPSPRSSARDRGYDARWDRASKQFLRAHPLCRGCEAAGRTEPATLTDHVIPHKGDRSRFWDRAWWQASCAWCHNVVKQGLEHRFEAGELVADDLWLDSPVARAARVQSDRPGGRVGQKSPGR